MHIKGQPDTWRQCVQYHILCLNSERSENIPVKKGVLETEEEADISALRENRDKKSYFWVAYIKFEKFYSLYVQKHGNFK